MVKLVFCIKRRQDLSEEEFFRYWREEHADLVTRIAPVMGIKRYIQSPLFPAPMNEIIQQLHGACDAYDGVAELWWDDIDAFIEAVGSPEGMEAEAELRDDEANFIDLAASCIFFTEERTVL